MFKAFFVALKDAANPPGEFQILPDGKIDIEGDQPAILDAAAAGQIIATFNKRGNDMVIDYEHQTLAGTEAPAAGWIKKLIYKGKEGLWAVVEWTERAKQFLANREYRYFSPVIWISEDHRVTRIENVALTNYPRINNLRPIIAKMSMDEARSEQEARSKKYGIAVKDGGHLTKPGEWSNVPDDEFLDPVNYRYPCPDAGQTQAAAGYWGHPDNQAQYSSEEKTVINSRLDNFEKKFGMGKFRKEASMLEWLKQILGLAKEVTEDTVKESVQVVVNKAKASGDQTVIACKEVLTAIGAKETAPKEEVLRIIAAMKAPGDVAVILSQEVAALKQKISTMEQTDLVQLALKEGKTSPEELEKWGRDLALKSPEQFKLIVLARPAGSVIPVGGIPPAPPQRDGGLDDAQKTINRMMGISDETFTKYNKTA